MNVDMGFKRKITSDMLCYSDGKTVDTKDNNWNAFYAYDLDLAYVNLNSSDLKATNNEDALVWQISRAISHEALHKAIYECTATYSNNFEDELIEKVLDEVLPCQR